MTFEKLVHEYEQLKYQIRRLEIKEQELRLLGGFPKSDGIDNMTITKNNSSTIENLVIKLSELKNRRNTYKTKLEDTRQQILTSIDLSSNLLSREIIEIKTFIPRCSWDYIAAKVFLSESRCRHLYYAGIEEINQKLNPAKEGKYEI